MAGTSEASLDPIHLLGLPSWSQQCFLLAGRLSNLAKPKVKFSPFFLMNTIIKQVYLSWQMLTKEYLIPL